MLQVQHQLLELVAAVLSADRRLLIAAFGLLFDLSTGLAYNLYPDMEWACDAYFLGDAVAATCYMWTLLLFKRNVLFEFGLALYSAKLLEEVFGNPTEPNPWNFLVIGVLFVVIRYKFIERITNGISPGK